MGAPRLADRDTNAGPRGVVGSLVLCSGVVVPEHDVFCRSSRAGRRRRSPAAGSSGLVAYAPDKDL